MIAVRTCHFHPGRRNVIEIISAMRWQFDGVERELVEPLLWHTERHVRFHESTGDEKWFVTLLRQLFSTPIDDSVIRHLFIRVRQGIKLNAPHAIVFGRFMSFQRSPFSIVILCPIASAIIGAVINLSGSINAITALEKM